MLRPRVAVVAPLSLKMSRGEDHEAWRTMEDRTLNVNLPGAETTGIGLRGFTVDLLTGLGALDVVVGVDERSGGVGADGIASVADLVEDGFVELYILHTDIVMGLADSVTALTGSALPHGVVVVSDGRWRRRGHGRGGSHTGASSNRGRGRGGGGLRRRGDLRTGRRAG